MPTTAFEAFETVMDRLVSSTAGYEPDDKVGSEQLRPLLVGLDLVLEDIFPVAYGGAHAANESVEEQGMPVVGALVLTAFTQFVTGVLYERSRSTAPADPVDHPCAKACIAADAELLLLADQADEDLALAIDSVRARLKDAVATTEATR